MMMPILITIGCLCGISLILGDKSPIIRIRNGTLEGSFMTSRKGRQFVSFRGIPYAQPPTRELRFEPPQPSRSWTGVRLAKEDSNVCLQRDMFAADKFKVVGVEDCLYLNVYTPKLPSNETDRSKRNYPVMIWIHGGGWFSGYGISKMYGPKFILDHDVVLVTVNYRLGVLGFFSTEDLVCPGNQGLKDQTHAIKWVNENIIAFNGDPNNITIFGESAGAGSTHYHMITPLSTGLFHRVISQSGSVLTPWAVNRPGNAKNESKKMATNFNCTTDDSSELVKCLKTKNAFDIVSAVCLPEIFDQCPVFSFRPVIEPDHPGAFIKEEPAKTLKSGKIAHVPWLTGTNAQEGSLIVSALYGFKSFHLDKTLDEQFIKLAPRALAYDETCPEESIVNVTKSIRRFYLGDKKVNESTKWNVIDMFTDAWFFIGADNAVRDHHAVLNSSIYYYYFAYKRNASFSDVFGGNGTDFGVCHADDLQYLFPVGELYFVDKPLQDEDLKIVDVMTKLWVNFAKTGNPTPEITSDLPFEWKPVTTTRLEYLYIGNAMDLHMANNLHRDRVDFWESIPHRGKILTSGDIRNKYELKSTNI